MAVACSESWTGPSSSASSAPRRCTWSPAREETHRSRRRQSGLCFSSEQSSKALAAENLGARGRRVPCRAGTRIPSRTVLVRESTLVPTPPRNPFLHAHQTEHTLGAVTSSLIQHSVIPDFKSEISIERKLKSSPINARAVLVRESHFVPPPLRNPSLQSHATDYASITTTKPAPARSQISNFKSSDLKQTRAPRTYSCR